MTLKAIDRVSRHPIARREEETCRRIRFASHRVGHGAMLVIWIGPELAKLIGLDCARAAVDLFLDDDFSKTRIMGLRANAEGQFRAARRSQNVGIYLNCESFAHYFGEVWFHDLADEQSIVIHNGVLQFVAPAGRQRVRK